MGKGINVRELSKKIKFGKDDKPDEYGATKKMYAIFKLVDEGKTLDDADFEVNEYDRLFFKLEKENSDLVAEKGQKPIRFVNDF